MHRRCCLPGWDGTAVPPHSGHQQAASSVHYTTSCKYNLVLLRMGEIIARNMLGWLKLLIKLLLLHLVGCLYYWSPVSLALYKNKQGQVLHLKKLHIYIYIYTGCHRRKGPNFGRVFLRSNYNDITQNTYIQSSMVTEIMAREVWNFDSYYSLIDYQIHIETGRNMWFL